MAQFKVQKRVKPIGAAKSIGNVWQTIATGKRKIVAERIAMRARIDHDDLIRIVAQ